ncbi:MAG: thioredoxin domain-containing protein [Hyphomicrobiales bacterium]
MTPRVRSRSAERSLLFAAIAALSLAPAACGSSGGKEGPGPALRIEALPGAAPFDASLVRRLDAAWAARPAGYAPRTRHLRPDGSPRYVNRLFLESSPYLKQHAHNPVNWYPWGKEAFETARRLGRPILLSVGYSTCHWCHVMEEESFEDVEIARYLNEHYVAIKVDREERPDVDGIYMTAVQLMTGGGGWPMTVWLTPDGKPFYGGSYFPPRDGVRGAPIGFLTAITRLDEVYRKEHDKVAKNSEALTAAVREALASDSTGAAGGAGAKGAAGAGAGAGGFSPAAGAKALDAALHEYRARFDEAHGGLEGSPKFPSSLPIRLLLRDAARTGDAKPRAMAALTLERMAAGGIHDPIGGGFHRYSTDEAWRVPHFEKMLYDQALAAIDYVVGYQATGREAFAAVARDVIDAAERDLGAPGGAFYGALDADSKAPDGRREEGRFYTWTPAEIEAAIGPERARVVERAFGVTAEGNFGERTVLTEARAPDQVARDLGMPAARVRSLLDEARPLLLAARAKRPAPHRDEKIVASWNGLMISALARAALALDDTAYAARASGAADFLLTKLRDGDRLHRSYQEGAAHGEGYLDDYAFTIAGLLDLYEATGDAGRLRDAKALDRALAAHFEDRENGGYFFTPDDGERLLAREKPAYDGAEPSGNSVEAMNLLRLYELTGDDAYRVRADRTIAAFAGTLARAPGSMSELLLAIDFRIAKRKEIVIVTPHSRSEASPFLVKLRAAYVPNRVLVVAVEGADLAAQAKETSLLADRKALGGKATAYVCVNNVCALPARDPETFAKQLAAGGPGSGSGSGSSGGPGGGPAR